jgi:predicted transcriptional regulator
MSKIRERLGPKANDTGALESDDGSAKRGPRRTFNASILIQLLAEGVSQTRAGELVGITQPAVSVFQKREDVRARIAELRTGAREAAKDRLAGMVRGALDVLDEIMHNAGCEPKDRIAAAKEILARALDIDAAQSASAALTPEDYELARRFLAERDAPVAQPEPA